MKASEAMEVARSRSASLVMPQFLAWVADRARTYPETMAAWRSTCPRLPVWENAIIERLVRIDNKAGRAVVLTALRRAMHKDAQSHAP